MASNYNAGINVLGVQDKKAQDALRKLLENSQYLKASADAAERSGEDKLKRLQKSMDAKVSGDAFDALVKRVAALEADASAKTTSITSLADRVSVLEGKA